MLQLSHMNHAERVFNFGQKRELTPTEALQKLYDTDDEVAVVVDRFVKRRAEILVYNDVSAEDRDVLEKLESEVRSTLSEQGIEISKEAIEEFLATL